MVDVFFHFVIIYNITKTQLFLVKENIWGVFFFRNVKEVLKNQFFIFKLVSQMSTTHNLLAPLWVCFFIYCSNAKYCVPVIKIHCWCNIFLLLYFTALLKKTLVKEKYSYEIELFFPHHIAVDSSETIINTVLYRGFYSL